MTARARSEGAGASAAKLEITLHRHASAIESEWRHLDESGIGTLFQRYDWCAAWLETIGRAEEVRPAILLGRLDGRPAFVLPLCEQRLGPARLAEWIGGSHSGYNFGLWSVEGAAHLRAMPCDVLVRRLGEALGVDALALRRVPLSCDGHAQPLAALGSGPSAVSGYSVSLDGGMEALLARTGGGSRRRRANQKERRMRDLGAVEIGVLPHGESTDAALGFFAAQKALRLAEQGLQNPFADEGAMDFLHELARRSVGAGEPVLSLSHLSLDGRTRAIIGSGTHRGRVYLQILTFVHDETLPHSPGQVLLYRQIEASCAEGRATYDFGIGQEGYKDSWSDAVHELRDHHAAFTALGSFTTAAMRFGDRARAGVRGSRWAAKMIRGLGGRDNAGAAA